MSPEDAAASGALPGEVPAAVDLRPSPDVAPPVPEAPTTTRDLRVPGGATHPFWFATARRLCPPMETTRRHGWVDGFVAGLEAVRGLDDDPALTEALIESVGLADSSALSTIDAMLANREKLARYLFHRQAAAHDAEPITERRAWMQREVREFWLTEADAILDFLP